MDRSPLDAPADAAWLVLARLDGVWTVRWCAHEEHATELEEAWSGQERLEAFQVIYLDDVADGDHFGEWLAGLITAMPMEETVELPAREGDEAGRGRPPVAP